MLYIKQRPPGALNLEQLKVYFAESRTKPVELLHVCVNNELPQTLILDRSTKIEANIIFHARFKQDSVKTNLGLTECHITNWNRNDINDAHLFDNYWLALGFNMALNEAKKRGL